MKQFNAAYLNDCLKKIYNLKILRFIYLYIEKSLICIL